MLLGLWHPHAPRSCETPGFVLLEPPSTTQQLPSGLMPLPALLKVHNGTVYVPILNVNKSSAVLPPHCPVGILTQAQIVSLPRITQVNDLLYRKIFRPGANIVIVSQPQSRAPIGNLLATRPNEVVAIDFSYLEPSTDGPEQVLVLTDVFSKFTQVIPTRDQQASTVAGILLKEWFYWFGVLAWLRVGALRVLLSISCVTSTRFRRRFNRTMHNLLHTLYN